MDAPGDWQAFRKRTTEAAMSRSTLHCLPVFLAAAVLLPPLAGKAAAQIKHDCPKPLDSEFRMVNLVNRSNGDLMEPMKMDFDMDAEGNVDIYYVERKGR